MSVVRLELDVPEADAAEWAQDLVRDYVNLPVRSPAVRSARVTVLSDFEVQRERTLLAAAQYFYPLAPGAGHGR